MCEIFICDNTLTITLKSVALHLHTAKKTDSAKKSVASGNCCKYCAINIHKNQILHVHKCPVAAPPSQQKSCSEIEIRWQLTFQSHTSGIEGYFSEHQIIIKHLGFFFYVQSNANIRAVSHTLSESRHCSQINQHCRHQ